MNPTELEAIASTTQVIILSGQMEEFLRVLHIIGISMGLGGSLFADYLSFDMLMLPGRNGVTEARTVTRIHWFIFIGLGLIWLSGIGIALNKFTFDTIPNKLVVKIIVVTALSINAILIGRYLVPISKKYQSPILRFMTEKDIKVSALIICVSITCWFSALFVSKIVALQQMSILLLLFVIGGCYLLLFLAVQGFLNYAKSVLLSNSHGVYGHLQPASAMVHTSSETAPFNSDADSIHQSVGTASPELDVPPVTTTPIENHPPRSRRSLGQINNESMPFSELASDRGLHAQSVKTPVQNTHQSHVFARGMTFQYSPYFSQWVMEQEALNFSQAFHNPNAKFPWFDALEISNQMSHVRNIKVALVQGVKSSSKTSSQHRSRSGRHILTGEQSSHSQRPKASASAPSLATPSSPAPSSSTTRRNLVSPSNLRGRAPLISQPALS